MGSELMRLIERSPPRQGRRAGDASWSHRRLIWRLRLLLHRRRWILLLLLRNRRRRRWRRRTGAGEHGQRGRGD